MWTAAKVLFLRWALARSFGGLLAILLAVAVPLGGILKVIGLPLLLVALVVGAPVILLLLLVGLPVLLVLGAAGAIVALVTAVLGIGMALLKLLFPVILVVGGVVAAVLGVRWLMRRGRGGAPAPPAPASPPPYAGPVSDVPPTASTIDPLET